MIYVVFVNLFYIRKKRKCMMKATCIINLGTCLSGIEPTKFIIDNLVAHGCNK